MSRKAVLSPLFRLLMGELPTVLSEKHLLNSRFEMLSGGLSSIGRMTDSGNHGIRLFLPDVL